MSLAPILILDRPLVRSLEPLLEDAEAAFRGFVEAADPLRAAGLALAAHLNGHSFQLSTSQLEWLLPRLDDPVLLPCLLACCPAPVGDRVEVLLRLLDREPGADVQVSALLSAALLGQGSAPGAQLVRHARRLVRGSLPFHLRLPVAAACGLLDAPELKEPSESVRALAKQVGVKGLLYRFRRCLEGDFLEALPDLGAPGLTARRAEPKVGRNDKCPCGSGKKFKKCCAQKSSQQYEVATRPLTGSKHFHCLPVNELVAIDPHTLTTDELERLVEELGFRGLLEEAEWRLELLLERADLDDHPDVYRHSLILEAQRRGDLEAIARQIAKIDPDGPEAANASWLRVLVQNGSVQELAACVQGALGDRSLEIELAYAMLELYPALGIYFGRAALGRDREFDSIGLLGQIERALDRLDLPPEDRFQQLWDQASSVDKCPTPGTPREEGGETLRQRLQSTADELVSLKTRLHEAERQLAKSSALPPESTTPARPVPSAPSPAPVDESELRRLRGRLDELKQLLKERNQERTQLRQQLAQQTSPTQATAPTRRGDPAEAEDLSETEAGEPVGERYGVLIPEFAREATRQLDALPSERAAQAIRAIGQLGAGDESSWQGVKYLKEGGGCFSLRLGLYYRLLFRIDPGRRRLLVEHVIPRAELERVLRKGVGGP